MARILAVDDDESFGKMLRISLIRLGHNVVVAKNGSEAIREFQREKPDLVLTDIVMPDKEGLETIMELRRLDPTVKIIAMSSGGGGPEGEFLVLAEDLGAAATLAKPFTLDDIKAALEKVRK